MRERDKRKERGERREMREEMREERGERRVGPTCQANATSALNDQYNTV